MGRTEPTGRLQASLGRHGKASKETNEDHSFGVQRRGVSKKDLTEPTLLEITDFLTYQALGLLPAWPSYG